MKIEEIYAITPRPDGWRILPDGKYIKLGNYVTLGDWVTLGNGVTLGNYVMLGNGVTLGNYVMLGNNVKLGDWVMLGDNETSEKLNLARIEGYKQSAKTHIFDKWVKPDRSNPQWGGAKQIFYKKNSIIKEPEAKISDQQCDVGLHVFIPNTDPNQIRYDTSGLIKIRVRVNSEDICYAGMIDFSNKVRVRKLKVLN